MRRPLTVAVVLLAACAMPAPPQTGNRNDLDPATVASGPSVSGSPARGPRVSRSHARPKISRPVPHATAKHAPRPTHTRPGRPAATRAGYSTWRHSAEARRILACESHTNYTDMSRHGGVIYYGAWQANAGFWRTYGGDSRYLSDRSRFTAPAAMQDAVAYRGWLARGWSPWACA